MEIVYWIAVALLGVLYVYAGGAKLVRSREQLLPLMQWVQDTPMPAVRAIGAIELTGVAGLVLPPLLGIAPWLALAAAIGFVLLQLFATRVHLARGEGLAGIGINLVLIVLALAAIAAWLGSDW